MHAVEVCSYQLPVPCPVVFGVTGGMHTGVSAAMPDVLLEGGLLAGVQNVAGGHQKNDGVITREVGGGKKRRILGKIDDDSLAHGQSAQGRNGVGDRCMAKGCCF